MARSLRIQYPGAVYHLTARGNRQESIYLSDSDRVAFLDILDKTVRRYGWICHAYCLMDNHYHNSRPDPMVSFEIALTQSDWTTFWEKVERLGVWKWKKQYCDPEILDGTQWELKFKINNKSQSIYGSNHYPESFDAFQKAVSELIGGLPVR